MIKCGAIETNDYGDLFSFYHYIVKDVLGKLRKLFCEDIEKHSDKDPSLAMRINELEFLSNMSSLFL